MNVMYFLCIYIMNYGGIRSGIKSLSYLKSQYWELREYLECKDDS